MFHRALRPAKLWRRRFMDRLKKSVSKMMTTSFLCDLIGWDVNIRMHWFFFLTANFTFFAFPLSSKCNRAKGCASGPVDVTSVVALRFREERPVSVIGLWETRSLEAKPSFLTFFSSDEQFSSRTWRFFLAFNSVSIVGIAFSGRPWELLAHTKELWLPFEGLG